MRACIPRTSATQRLLLLARPHQVNAREQHAIDVAQRLDSSQALLLEQLPLRLGEAEITWAVNALHKYIFQS